MEDPKELNSKWIGPCEIISMDGVNATIKTLQKVHVNRLKSLY